LGVGEAALLEAALVERIALDEVIAQRPGGPNPKLRAALGVYAVTDRDDGIQIVVLDSARDLASSLGLNYREFLGRCRLRQLLLGEDVLEVETNVVGCRAEQRGHLALGKPDGLGIDAHFHLHAAFGRGVKGDVLRSGSSSHAARSGGCGFQRIADSRDERW
jgi:hypothetical protein